MTGTLAASSPTRRSPGGCRPRPARSATRRSTPTRRRSRRCRGYLPVDGGGDDRVLAAAQRPGHADRPERLPPDLGLVRRRARGLPVGPSPPPSSARGRVARWARRCRCSRWAACCCPGRSLPLHVFEPRYRQLVIDCLADDTGDPEFGVTLIERGRRSAAATSARRSARSPGWCRSEPLDRRPLRRRSASAAAGSTVERWLPDDPYPIADVERGPTAPGRRRVLHHPIGRARRRVRDVRRLAHEAAAAAAPIGEAASPDTDDSVQLGDDPVLASYQLATCRRSAPPTATGCCMRPPSGAPGCDRRRPRRRRRRAALPPVVGTER